MPTMLDANGDRTDVKLGLTLYKEAVAEGLTVPQLINRKYPTAPDATQSSFEQLCESAGLLVGTDREFGLKSPTIGSVLDGSVELNTAAVADPDPASRILYPAIILELIDEELSTDRTTDPNNFDKMVGTDISVTKNRIEQPRISLEPAERKRSKAISQLAEPEAMLTITTRDTSRAISTFAIGLEVSDQALQETTMDFVSMAVRRQTEVERNARAYDYLLGCLQGDLDNGDAALAQTKADTYDSTISTAGSVTKKALIKWLLNNSYKRTLSHVVTDIDGLLAIESALENTNTNQYIEGGLVPSFSIMNKMIQKLQIFVVDPAAGWPVNTLMGLDSRYAITRIRNSAAAYSAVEQFVLRRSSAKLIIGEFLSVGL